MSKLSELRGKGNTIKLSNDLELNLTPMTLDDEVTIAAYQEAKEYVKAISFLVKTAIKRAIPDATDEEINNLNKEDIKVITQEVMKLNGLISEKKEETMKESPSN